MPSCGKKKYNNKKAIEKVKRRVIAQDIETGRLGMIDMELLQDALCLGWVPKLINKSTDKETWKTYPTLVYSNLCLNLEILAHHANPKICLPYLETPETSGKKTRVIRLAKATIQI